MNATAPSPNASARGLAPALALLLCTVALWLWVEWCRFPWSTWNDVRLVPAFMAAAGEPVYSPERTGVISTWMYGPVPVWLLRPAAWMPDLGSASLMAATINLGLMVAAIVFACLRWPQAGLSVRTRLLAAGLVAAAWPEAAWRFIQADNFAVALGLFSSLLLLSSRASAPLAWLSALAAAAAVGCKQTAVALPLAQLVWLGLFHGRGALVAQALRLAAAGAALAIATLACFDPAGLWLNLVVLPGRLPLTDQLGPRVLALLPHLGVQIGIPAAIFIALRRQPDPGGARRLASLLWLCSLPLGLLSILKIGGTINSLQGFQLALPALALAVTAAVERSRFRLWPVLGGALLVLLLRIQDSGAPLHPRIRHLREGVALARTHPGRLWFPWNPLVSYYAEHRFYHSEDGLYVRFLAGKAATLDHARAYLPADFVGVAEPVGFNGWGISDQMLGTPFEEQQTGSWRVRVAIRGTPPHPEW